MSRTDKVSRKQRGILMPNLLLSKETQVCLSRNNKIISKYLFQIQELKKKKVKNQVIPKKT